MNRKIRRVFLGRLVVQVSGDQVVAAGNAASPLGLVVSAAGLWLMSYG